MKEIQLTKGKVVVVDDDDYEWLNRWKWHYNGRYAVRWEGKKNIYMHREIMKTPGGMETDHINRDSLNNCRSNLRICTHAENIQNRNKQSNNTSGYNGVYWHKKAKKWVAGIRINQVRIYLGVYSIKEDAAKTYDQAARKLFGEFAKTNFN